MNDKDLLPMRLHICMARAEATITKYFGEQFVLYDFIITILANVATTYICMCTVTIGVANLPYAYSVNDYLMF